ncbi:MAG: carboxypeptidase regulatory-like domain-containing protein [Cyanobacteria bacterium]|nr:carboxypeptidase regulatory-like domain-containing protein [Cyanobacteriota bacterium]
MVGITALPWSATLQAQAGTAAIEGTVTDATGAALPGTSVVITHEESGITRTITTGADGRFQTPALRPGRYTVTSELAGFAPATQTGVMLTVGSTSRVTLTMSLAGRTEAITVTGQAPLIDTATAEVGITVTTPQIANLPLNSREFLDLANLAGAAKPDVFRPYNDVQVGAMSGRMTNVSVDGMDNNRELNGDPNVRFSLDAVQEFKVVTNGFMPEFGRASGGLVNVVTKSGTNNIDGTAFGYFRDRSLNARNAFEVERAPFSRQQSGVAVGGPIVKNRAHFFGNFEGHRINTQKFVNTRGAFPAFERTIEQGNRNYLGSGKVDVQLNSRHSLTGRYSRHRTRTPSENGGGAVTAEAAYSREGEEQSAMAAHTWVMSARALNEARAQYSTYMFAEQNNSSEVGVDRGGLLLTGNGGGCCDAGATERYFEFRDDLSYQATGAGGEHRVKAGVSWKRVQHGGFDNAYKVGQFVFDTAAEFDSTNPATYPSQFRIGVGTGRVEAVNQLIGAYVQDSLKATEKLTINYGVRYDVEVGAVNPGGAPGTRSLVDASRRRTDTNNWAPRVQFTYDLGGDGATVLRGGYGIFYDQILMGLRTSELRTDGQTYNIATITDPNRLRNFPNVAATLGGLSAAQFLSAAPPDVTIIGNDIATPYSRQLTVGMSRQIGAVFVASAEYLRVDGRDEIVLVDRNPPVPPAFARTNTAFRRIRVYESLGRSQYDGMYLRLDKRFDGRWQMLATYNLARGLATADSPFSIVSDPFNIDADYGPSSYVQRHRVSWSGVFVLPLDMRLGSILTWASPLPYNITAGLDINRDLNNIDRPSGVRRNAGGEASDIASINAWRSSNGLAAVTADDLNGANYFNWDVRVSRSFNLGGQARLEAMLEAFNLTNRANYIRFVTNARLASLGQPTVAGEPRQVQLGLRFTF